MEMQDRKKRVHVSKDVFINRAVRAEGLDLSEDGMYLYTRHPYIVGSIVEVTFSLAGEKVSVTAKVMHSQPGIGLGVKFSGISGEAAKRIKTFVEARGTSES